ncbi:hypothetical protein ACWCSH_47070, partial [Streptosporangium sp. NPDC001682]
GGLHADLVFNDDGIVVDYPGFAKLIGFNSLMRSIGTSVSAAVIGVVLTQMTMRVGGHTLPSESGFRTGLLIGCGVALVAAAIASAIPARRAGSSAEDAEDAEDTVTAEPATVS